MFKLNCRTYLILFLAITFVFAKEEKMWNAINNSDVELAQKAIKKGADVNALSPYGLSTLMKAVTTQSMPMISLLIDNNVSLDGQDSDGETALSYAVNYRRSEIVDKLISSGASLDVKNNKGETALFHAVREKDSVLVDKLISSGASLDIKNNKGETALFLAVREKDSVVLEKLISSGASLNIKNDEGETPLLLAAKSNEEILTILLSKNVVIGDIDNDQNTLLHLALKNNVLKHSCKMFVGAGIPVNSQNSKGETPLILATKSKNYAIMKELIECGADVALKDKSGKNPLVVAALNYDSLGIRTLTDTATYSYSVSFLQKLITNTVDVGTGVYDIDLGPQKSIYVRLFIDSWERVAIRKYWEPNCVQNAWDFNMLFKNFEQSYLKGGNTRTTLYISTPLSLKQNKRGWRTEIVYKITFRNRYYRNVRLSKKDARRIEVMGLAASYGPNMLLKEMYPIKVSEHMKAVESPESSKAKRGVALLQRIYGL